MPKRRNAALRPDRTRRSPAFVDALRGAVREPGRDYFRCAGISAAAPVPARARAVAGSLVAPPLTQQTESDQRHRQSPRGQQLVTGVRLAQHQQDMHAPGRPSRRRRW
ncbi:hypothetical protein SBADM41S_04808 [Streptomyces badius]